MTDKKKNALKIQSRILILILDGTIIEKQIIDIFV